MSEEIIEVHPSFVYLQELEQRVRDTLLENAKLHHELASLREWQNWPLIPSNEERDFYFIKWVWPNGFENDVLMEIEGDPVHEMLFTHMINDQDKCYREPIKKWLDQGVKFLAYCGPFKAPEGQR